jgi:hypothetical protein
MPTNRSTVPDADKGKGKDITLSPFDDSSGDDSGTSVGSDVSAQSRRRRERRRRRADRHFERLRQKHPGAHRPNCGCPTCQSASGGPPCWACSAPRAPPPPQPPLHPPAAVVMLDRDGNPLVNHHRQRPVRPGGRRQHNYPPPPFQAPPPPPPPGGWRMPEGRIFGEDLRTWLLAYELNIDVYILANKYLMDGFKREVAKATIDMLETAGSDAAAPQVLRLCAKLRQGLPESDPLLKMVFARVGFLQSLLWRKEPESTEKFLHENPEVAAIILRETVVRREEDYGGRSLPSMERPWSPPYEPGPGQMGYRAPAPYGNYAGRPRW